MVCKDRRPSPNDRSSLQVQVGVGNRGAHGNDESVATGPHGATRGMQGHRDPRVEAHTTR